LAQFEQNGSRIKRFGKPESSDVNEALFKWFKQQRSDSVPVSSPFVKINFVPPDGRTDRDMSKLIATNCSFVNAPKNGKINN